MVKITNGEEISERRLSGVAKFFIAIGVITVIVGAAYFIYTRFFSKTYGREEREEVDDLFEE